MMWKVAIPQRFSKRQSLSTTVLFRTMFTRMIIPQPTFEMTPGFKPLTDLIPLVH